MKKHLLTLCATFLLFSHNAHAFIASADMSNGYSSTVLQTVLQYYTMPTEATGHTTVLIRIANDGRPYSCEMLASSQDYTVDDAICAAVARAQRFAPPPNNMPSAEVSLTFVYDDVLPIASSIAPDSSYQSSFVPDTQNYESSPTAPLNYAEQIMANAQPHLILPSELPSGAYSVQVQLLIGEQGEIISYVVLSPSASPIFDNFIRDVLSINAVIPVPTSGVQDVTLSFSASK